MLPLPLAPWGSLLSAQPNSWLKAGLLQFPSWKESSSFNQPTPSFPACGSSWRMVPHPAPPTRILRPQTETVSGVDRPFQIGEERAYADSWTPGRKYEARQYVWG